MAKTVERLWCKTCNQETKCEREGANHLLHFFISLFTLWVWTPGWYYAAKSAPTNCTVCGTVVKQPSKLSAALPAIITFGLWLFGVVLIAQACTQAMDEVNATSATTVQP